jgi:hypothetical protein
LLYPQRNLIKPFTDSDWFRDVTVPDPTVEIVNPYKIIMTTTMSAQGRLLWIPVELGKTYTFSFKYISGLYRIYKRKVNNHDNTMVLVQDAGAGKPDTFTFTVDSSYQGFITLRLTYGAAGVIVFENLQLEEGTTATPFKPYTLGNKKSVLPKEVINSDMSGAGSHVYPYGNVISVKEDVRLWGYKIQVGTPWGTFDSVIYEWNNGSFGQPIFREVITATASGVIDLSYKGTLLKAGKKYYIGRNDPNRNNDSTGNAGVYRKTGVPAADYKFITTLGGTQFYSPAIDFPSTWYYIFGLEIEAVRHSPAILTPNNLFDPNRVTNGFYVNDANGGLSTSSAGAAATDYIPVKGGKTYTFENMPETFKLIMRFAWYDANKVFIGGSNYYTASNVPKDVTAPNNAAYMRFTALPSEFSRVLFYQKDIKANTKATLSPTRNLITNNPFKWSSGSAGGTWELFVDPTRIRMDKRIRIEPNTKYTVKVDGNYDVYVRQFAYEGGFEVGSSQWSADGAVITTTPNTLYVGIIIRKKDNTALDVSHLQIAKPMLVKGSTSVNIPYVEANPLAILSPEGNLLPPLSDPNWFTKQNQLVGEVKGDYEFKMSTAAVAVVGKDLFIKLDPNKTYTVGATVIGSGARLRVMRQKDEYFQININPSSPIQTFKPISGDMTIRLENNGQAGDYTTKDFFLYEGDIANPVFKPQKLVNPKL